MMKHSTLIRNKASVIYYHKGGSWNFLGEHKILGDKKGNRKLFSSKRKGQKILIKRIFLVLSFACIEIWSKTFLPEHLDYHEKFSCRFTAKNSL